MLLKNEIAELMKLSKEEIIEDYNQRLIFESKHLENVEAEKNELEKDLNEEINDSINTMNNLSKELKEYK